MEGEGDQCLEQAMHISFGLLGSLSNDVFERRTSNRSGLFAIVGRDVDQIYGQIISMREKTLTDTNLVASRHIKRKNATCPVDVRRSNTSLLSPLLTVRCVYTFNQGGHKPLWK